MEHPDIPQAEELFEWKFGLGRPPHPKILQAEKQLSEIGLLALEIANRDCARILVNACLFRSPITDREIEEYACRYQLSFVEAQAELRRLRDDS